MIITGEVVHIIIGWIIWSVMNTENQSPGLDIGGVVQLHWQRDIWERGANQDSGDN